MMLDDLDDQHDWIELLARDYRVSFGPGRWPRAANLDRLFELAGQLAAAHEAMADLYRRHLGVVTDHLKRLEDNDGRN